MTPEERDLINGLFDRLRSADTAQKDQEAEQLIQSKVGQQPAAPYLLAQTVLVQEHALNNAQARIAQLEKQLANASANNQNQGGGAAAAGGGGGFLSGLFGHKSSSAPAQSSPQSNQVYQTQGQQPPPMPAQQYAPSYPSTMNMPQSAGGGFLKTALAAAAGVAGGSLLMSGFQNLIGHNAGPFASSLGGGYGGLGGVGSGFLGGVADRPEIIENREEVVNNYYGGDNDNDRNQNQGQDQGNSFASSGDNPDQGNSFLGGNSLFGNDANTANADNNPLDAGFNTSLDDDTNSSDFDTSNVDFDNSDSGGFDTGGDDYSGGNDDGGGLV